MYKNSDIKFITIYYNSKIISKKKKNEKTIEIKKKKLSSHSSILITHEKKKFPCKHGEIKSALSTRYRITLPRYYFRDKHMTTFASKIFDKGKVSIRARPRPFSRQYLASPVASENYG